MPTRELITLTGCLAALGLFLAGCAPAAAPAPAPGRQASQSPAAAPPKGAPTPEPRPLTPKPATGAPSPSPKTVAQHGGHLPLPSPSDPPNLDIHALGVATLFAPIGGVYNGLLQYDQSDKIVADLAERWELSPDGKVYTFHLRKSVKWHDGKPFTSADAKISLERIDQLVTLKFVTEAIDKIETPDENTLRVTLKYPQMGFLASLAHGRTLMGPKHVIEAKGDLRRDAIGTGPFKLKEYVTGVSFSGVKNSDYFMKGLPYLDSVTYYIIRDAATRLAAFRAGRVKIYGHPPANGELTPSVVEAIKKTMPQAIVRPYATQQAIGLLPNTTKAPWSDVRVRRAAFLAVDRDKGLDVVMEGVGSLGISTFVGEWALPKDEMVKMPGFRKPKDQDIAEAKRLLVEAGYPKGFSSSVLVRAAQPVYEKAATFLRDQLANIDVDLKLEVIDYAIYTDRRGKLSFDTMLVLNNVPLPDPDASLRYLSWRVGRQFSTLDDERTHELFLKQTQTADTQERKKVVWDLQQRVAESVPHILLGWIDSFIAYWPEVKNYTATGGVFMHNKLEDIWLAK
ncbi:MAG: ABC transporter substrate-binding protein [Chloroflexi bacterium]|nr:ABC transporter substrate-binding protein [Chloroflexota bacterium]